jgi:heme exporter protein A
MISICDLSHRYGRQWALAGLSLELPAGHCLSLFGPNGAGKSTLLQILATLIRPTSGEVRVSGISARADPLAIRRQVGLVAHKPLLYPYLTGLENLVFSGRLYGLTHPERRAEALLERVGLWVKRHERVKGFSHGQLQRADIARALMHDPALLLLDEPYSGLDLAAAKRLEELLGEFSATGHTLVIATHNLQRGLHHSDRVAIMVSGRMIYEAESQTITEEALQAVYARAFDGQRGD